MNLTSLTTLGALTLGLTLWTGCPLPGKNIGDLPDDGGGGSQGSGESSAGGTPGVDTEAETGSETTAGSGLGGVCEGPLSDSWLTWAEARDEASSTYSFTMAETQVYADFCSGEIYVACRTSTTLGVVDGEVVSRTFEATPNSEDTTPEDCPEAYEETGEALGSHAEGYPVRTIDEVYQGCCDMALMQGGYYTSYDDEGWLPGEVLVSIGDDALLTGCSTQYCDDCGCDDGTHIVISDISLG